MTTKVAVILYLFVAVVTPAGECIPDEHPESVVHDKPREVMPRVLLSNDITPSPRRKDSSSPPSGWIARPRPPPTDWMAALDGSDTFYGSQGARTRGVTNHSAVNKAFTSQSPLPHSLIRGI